MYMKFLTLFLIYFTFAKEFVPLIENGDENKPYVGLYRPNGTIPAKSSYTWYIDLTDKYLFDPHNDSAIILRGKNITDLNFEMTIQRTHKDSTSSVSNTWNDTNKRLHTCELHRSIYYFIASNPNNVPIHIEYSVSVEQYDAECLWDPVLRDLLRIIIICLCVTFGICICVGICCCAGVFGTACACMGGCALCFRGNNRNNGNNGNNRNNNNNNQRNGLLPNNPNNNNNYPAQQYNYNQVNYQQQQQQQQQPYYQPQQQQYGQPQPPYSPQSQPNQQQPYNPNQHPYVEQQPQQYPAQNPEAQLPAYPQVSNTGSLNANPEDTGTVNYNV